MGGERSPPYLFSGSPVAEVEGTMPPTHRYRPETLHENLGEAFYDPVAAAEFPDHVLRFRNQRQAARVGLDGLDDAEWIDHFGRFVSLPGAQRRPLALRYHGHQFQTYNPDLGDGRGFLFAQLRDSVDGRLLDLGTKGSGQTPWSRRGDGRLTLKGGVREILATEMLEALGVDTSKSFSLIETGESLERGDEPSPTRASVLTRLSHSHIRIGVFQRLSYHDDANAIERLLNHACDYYYPHLRDAPAAQRATLFLDEVANRIAILGASYMAAGFVHGVLNTDNINITGESFDYGPWRFAPVYDPMFTAAYFDTGGLYAFGRQPSALAWNLARLAECLLHLTGQDAARAIIDAFPLRIRSAFRGALLRRLALETAGEAADARLAAAVVDFLLKSRAPFEQFFFDWRGGLASAARAQTSPVADHYQTEAFAPLRAALADHETAADARLDHPYFRRQTPCAMLIDEVEALWAPIAERDDWAPLEKKIADINEMREAYAGSALERAAHET
jgi:uncharacterized protein YdiU (UPF0061 family)